MKKAILNTAGALLLSAYACSSMAITALGVTWDPSSILDFEMKAGDLRETAVSAAGDTLYGYGTVSNINGSTSFCACDLTYVFTYTVQEVFTDALGGEIMFTGGNIKFYAQAAGTFNTTAPGTAQGTAAELWLEVAGHTDTFTGAISNGNLADPTGTLYGTFTGTIGGGEFGQGNGLLDVVGGAAAFYLDTNQEPDGSDLSFSSSFQPARNPIVDGDVSYVLSGTAEMFGSSQQVPAPATLLLVGLGLVSLVGARARKA